MSRDSCQLCRATSQFADGNVSRSRLGVALDESLQPAKLLLSVPRAEDNRLDQLSEQTEPSRPMRLRMQRLWRK